MRNRALAAGCGSFSGKALRAALLASAAMCLVVANPTSRPAFAQASAQAISLNIPAQDLGAALATLADRAGLRLLLPSSLVAGRTSPALSGSFTREDAIARLLTGTGLSYTFTDANTVTISDRIAAAHDGAIDADGSLLLDTITVAGSGGAFSADTPYQTAGSSTYISGEKVERFRGTSAGDMLSGTPGVFNADNRNGAALDVNIRGMQGQGRSPVIVDGAQQETTVYRGYSGVVGRSYVDPDFIGEVMVEKGPSSAADGAGIIGGAVRMNTISVDDIVLPDKSFGVRLKGGFNTNSSSVPPVLTYGGIIHGASYDNDAVPDSVGGPDGMDRPGFLTPTGGNGSIAAGFRSEYVDLVAAYARRKNGNYHAGTRGSGVPKPLVFRDCGAVNDNTGAWQCSSQKPGETWVLADGLNRFRAGEEVLNTSQDNESVLLKGTFRFLDDHQLDLGYMRYDSTYGEIMPSQLMSDKEGAFQTHFDRVVMNTYTAKYRWNSAGNDLVDLKVNAWMTDTALFKSLPANLDGNIGRRYGVNVENRSVFDTAWGSLSLNYGGAYTYETLVPAAGADLTRARDGDRREVSAFVSGEWKPKDWLTLNASLRYSDFKSNDTRPTGVQQTYYTIDDGDGGTREVGAVEWRQMLADWRASGSDPATRPISLGTRFAMEFTDDPSNYKSFIGDGFAPIFSATVEPWEGIQFYGKYAESIRLPSRFETTRGASTDPTPFDLRPEHAKMWEAGINVLRDDVFVSGDSVRFKASYFDNTVKDYLTRITTATSSPAPIANIDKAELRGIEIAASYDAGRFFGDLAYTHYTHTRFCTYPGQIGRTAATDLCYEGGVSNSYVVNHIPPTDSVSLTLGVRAFDEKLTAGGRLTYVGRRPVEGLSEQVGAAGTRMAVAQWKPYTTVDLFASYKVNENFQIDAAIDNVTDTYYMDALTLGLMPSPGRTFRLGMTTKF